MVKRIMFAGTTGHRHSKVIFALSLLFLHHPSYGHGNICCKKELTTGLPLNSGGVGYPKMNSYLLPLALGDVDPNVGGLGVATVTAVVCVDAAIEEWVVCIWVVRVCFVEDAVGWVDAAIGKAGGGAVGCVDAGRGEDWFVGVCCIGVEVTTGIAG
jgi:hypothetical protein